MTLTEAPQHERDTGRDELVLDLTTGSLQVGGYYASFESPAADEVLEVYLDLVRDMRGSEAALARGLRSEDLTVLGSVLIHEPAGLHDRLELLVAERSSLRARVRPWLGAIVATLVLLVVTAAAVAVAFVWRTTDSTVDEARVAPLAAGLPSPILSSATSSTQAIDGAVDELAASVVVTAPAEPAARTPRAERIESLIGWDITAALPGWTIVHTDRHETWRGLTNSIDRTVILFDRSETSEREAAAVLAHELGHAVDLDHLDDRQRAEWRRMRAITGPWWADDAAADFAFGAGDFAEAVAAVLVGEPTHSEYGPFERHQLDWVAALLADAADG